MATYVCPWWGGYFIDNRFRRLLHNPEAILAPYLRPGMTVLDVGCGMGFFSIAMARLVGPEGTVLAVDLQPQMLEVLARRAKKAGLSDRIQTHRCEADDLGIDAAVDFALAFAMIHEVPDARRLLGQIEARLRPGGRFFIAEPRLHVSGRQFDATVKTAEQLGLAVADQPKVRWCRACVLAKA
ncbi:MAG: class I SAM-dependent methyltransferase [Thermoguttaceae bacterium]|jgi:ubiquinone/menaquinone biosynthesis C-methylase UbiE|nr:class I SAM-dependent methyltransferase [Thermoguttaceae bacterium]